MKRIMSIIIYLRSVIRFQHFIWRHCYAGIPTSCLLNYDLPHKLAWGADDVVITINNDPNYSVI